jgi:hypothetical protein
MLVTINYRCLGIGQKDYWYVLIELHVTQEHLPFQHLNLLDNIIIFHIKIAFKRLLRIENTIMQITKLFQKHPYGDFFLTVNN